MHHKKSNLLLSLGMFALLFIQCKKEDDTQPVSSDCEVISSSLQVQGKSWEPCNNGFSISILSSGDTSLNIPLASKNIDGKAQLLNISILNYTGIGIYEPIFLATEWFWNELVNLQLDKIYLYDSGSLEILEHQDHKIRAKIDCIFSNSEGDVKVKGEFELKEQE